jgi:hypothetical protein
LKNGKRSDDKKKFTISDVDDFPGAMRRTAHRVRLAVTARVLSGLPGSRLEEPNSSRLTTGVIKPIQRMKKNHARISLSRTAIPDGPNSWHRQPSSLRSIVFHGEIARRISPPKSERHTGEAGKPRTRQCGEGQNLRLINHVESLRSGNGAEVGSIWGGEGGGA